MKKRILSLLLVLVTALGMFSTTALAASSEQEALGAINIFNGGYRMSYLSINGRIREQIYTYYNFTDTDGTVREIPAYCVNPNDAGVPQTVAEGESIEYLADEKASDPKVTGIIASGYPNKTLSELGLENKHQAYYATKMALWCYLLGHWDINDLKVNPNLTGVELDRAKNILAAANKIYRQGTAWTENLEPNVTCVPDRDVAYEVTIGGRQYKQQIFTFWSKTWVCDYTVNVAFTKPDEVPAGTRIVNMNNNDITTIRTESVGDGYGGQFKVLYPLDAVEGKTGGDQLSFTTNVYQYAIFYATCAEVDKYGNLQNYMVDTDPTTTMRLSAYTNYVDQPDDDPDETALRIIKYEAGTTIPLAGARFEVIDPDGATVGVFSTDYNGQIKIPLTIIGNYTVIELDAPTGYLIAEHPAQNVTVVYEEIAEVVFENEPYGHLRIEKTSNTGMNLPGASITIEHIESGKTYSTRTNSAGVAVFNKIQPGAYRIQETSAPDGWKLDDTIYTTNVLPGETTTFHLANEELPGLRIIKYDRVNMLPMPNVTFEVFRDGVSLGKFQTDEFGEILLTNIQPGTYRAFEVDTGNEGYILDTTPQEIELKAGDGIRELVFFNDQKPGMRLIKVDSADPSKVIPNAVFEIKSVAGDYGPEEYTTDENGEIDLSHLPTGAYVVTEKECAGYVIDDAQRIIQLNANETAQFVFTNSKRPGIRLIKLDSYDSSPLGGVTFRIAKIEDGTHYIDRVTDHNGEIYVEDLDPGVYSVSEIDVPEGYIKNDGEWHVELFPGRTSTLVVTNDRKSELKIIKTDKDTGEPVPGVTFILNKVNGPTMTTEATGPDGSVTILRLEPGVYMVTEQSVPEGYILDTEPQMVTLFPNRNATVRFQNHKRPTLTITKVDVNGKLLPGAIFEVRTKSGVKIGDFPVDENGTVTISNVHLDEGYYIVTEIQAPEGYILDKTPHEVYLRPGKTTEISIENEKNPDLLIRKIDSVVKDGLKGAKFEIWVSKDKSSDGTYQKLDSSYYYTDDDGLIRLDNLDTGWYRIVEVEPPAGFELKAPSEQTIYVDNDKSVEVTFENIPKSALVIRKVDADTGAGLPNAWFRVRYLGGTSGSGGTIIGEYQTSNNGNIIITGLDAGTYVVEEISAPDGYVLDTASQTAYISGKEQDCITLTFTNSKYGALLIKKVDAVTGEPLSDVQFFVTDSDGAVVGNANGKFVTDSAGTILISDILPGTTLVVKETRTRDGYILDETPQTIKIQSNATMTLEFRNQPKGGLIIYKLDSITKAPLAGVQFQITYADGSFVDAQGGKLSSKGFYVTDKNGQIKLDGITGTLVVTEVETIPGYTIDEATRSQTVAVNPDDTQSLYFYNVPNGSLTITKVDSVTGKSIPGVEFKISGIEGCKFPGGTYTTDDSGVIHLDSLPAGAYSVVETRAAEGYLADNSIRTVRVTGGKHEKLTIQNDPLGGLLIKKMDSITKEPLADVIFKVTTVDGTVVGASGGEFRTDERGYISIPGLEPGGYIVREVQAAVGYLLEDTPKAIEIKDGRTYELEFFNDPMGGLIIHKLDSVTKKPLEGVQFKIAYADGKVVDDEGGKLSSNGLYWTDGNGQIQIDGITGTLVVTEVETIPGYTIHEETRSQTVVVNPDDTQSLYFYNDPVGGLELVKVNEDDKTQRIPNTTFEIRKVDDELIETVTTDKNGRVFISLPDGAYYAVETEAGEGFKLDNTPHYFEVENGKTVQLQVTNQAFSGIKIHKIDAVTGKGIYGVTFLLYDANQNPIGQYTSDQDGWVWISHLPGEGKYFLRELENEGYIPDNQLKTVYVEAGATSLIEWENIPITAQIQIVKKSADYNPTNGLPAGTLLEGAVFEIYDKAGNLVDTIRSDYRGLAASRPLPLGRYTIREVKAPANYGVNEAELTAYLEHEGQIVRFEVTNKALTTGVSITKTGPKEIMAGQPVRYAFSNIANNSNVRLDSFYWRDTLPAEVRLETVVTGTYNFPGTYKIVYRVNGGEYQTLADNLSTGKNYTLAASPVALGLASNERVTEVMFVFGQAPAGFAQVEKPYLHCKAVSSLASTSFVNVADVGGVYNGQWVQAVSRWVINVYGKPVVPTLPRTGY